MSQGEHDEAIKMYEQAIELDEKNDDPQLAAHVENLAVLLWEKDRVDEALPYYERLDTLKSVEEEEEDSD